MQGDVLKVYLLDGSYKTLNVDPNTTTVEQLWLIMCDKYDLDAAASECFFIWGYGPKLHLLLFNDSTIASVLQDWHEWEDKYTKPTRSKRLTLSRITGGRGTPAVNAAPRFVFRTASILASDALETNLAKANAVMLFYTQAVYDVIHSNYPTDEGTAIDLAGMQRQVSLGDYNPATHTEEQLLEKGALELVLPEHVVRSSRSSKRRELAGSVLSAHRRHQGHDGSELMRRYLTTVSRFASFGSTFFRVRWTSAESTFLKHQFEGEVSLGVSQEGVHVVDPYQMRVRHYTYEDIQGWGYDESMFWFKVKDASESVPCVFETAMGELIYETVMEWTNEVAALTKRMTELDLGKYVVARGDRGDGGTSGGKKKKKKKKKK